MVNLEGKTEPENHPKMIVSTLILVKKTSTTIITSTRDVITAMERIKLVVMIGVECQRRSGEITSYPEIQMEEVEEEFHSAP